MFWPEIEFEHTTQGGITVSVFSVQTLVYICSQGPNAVVQPIGDCSLRTKSFPNDPESTPLKACLNAGTSLTESGNQVDHTSA